MWQVHSWLPNVQFLCGYNFPGHSRVFLVHTIDSSDWKKQFNNFPLTREPWELYEDLPCFSITLGRNALSSQAVILMCYNSATSPDLEEDLPSLLSLERRHPSPIPFPRAKARAALPIVCWKKKFKVVGKHSQPFLSFTSNLSVFCLL